MCELIQDSARDPQVQACARYAQKHFGMGSSDPGAIAWGVFWYVKHCVRFRLDEHTMFQVGENPEQDLLIAPAVLVRMQDPSEDCDGFTMLTAALLTVLSVPILICTVATEPQDPSRWSHVFLCAVVNGRMLPLDTSHGPCPGWMVPRNRIYRFQAWTIDGRPANVSIPSYQGLHGYGRGLGARGAQRAALRMVPRRRGVRGLGQACATSVCTDSDDPSDPTSTCLAWDDSSCQTGSGEGGIEGSGLPTGTSSSEDPISSAACPAGYSLGSGGFACVANNPNPNVGGSSTPSVTPNYAAMVSAIASAASQDVKAVIQQPQALLQAQTWANLTSYLPIIGLGVVGLVIFTSLIGSKK